MPTTRPLITWREGQARARKAATITTKSGLAPFNMPVSAELIRCSAKGNMLSGNAIQRRPTQKMPGQSSRGTGRRAAGTKDRVAKPIRIRRKVMPFGGIAPSPSAMKRNEAPQMSPGAARRSQSLGVWGARGLGMNARGYATRPSGPHLASEGRFFRGKTQARSKRSRFITLVHAATKSFTKVSFASLEA